MPAAGSGGGALKTGLPALLTAGAFTVLLGFLFANRGHLGRYYTVHPEAFLAIALLTAIILMLLGLANKIHFGAMGMKGSWYDWFHLVTVSSFTNYLPANAGIAVKAFYLKRIHGTPYRTFLAGQGALFLIFAAAAGACGLAALLAWPPERLPKLIAGALLAMTAAGGLLLLPRDAARRLGGSYLGESLAAARTGPRAVGAVALCQGSILVATATSLKISFDMGPAEVPLAACVVLAALAPLSRLVAVTPGALGVRELLLGGLAYLMGFTVRDAIIASTFSRLVEFAVVCSLGSFFTYRLSGKIVSSFDGDPFPGTNRYWEDRYAGGGSSGLGSEGRAAELKAAFLNDFVSFRGLTSVVEFGCGDGRQLALATYERYLGFDVSPTAVATCRRRFAGDGSKEFRLLDEYGGETAELVLSLDVIYHLVEDEVFENHMKRLFRAATRYVVIYSTDTERQAAFGRGHVRHRRFTDWIAENASGWQAVERRRGWHRLGRFYRGEHRPDFFVFERRPPQEGTP